MPFENFDNKIKEAADQHHPDYDEKAWSKMEKLLDEHLPQRKDRRRRIIFFLLFFLFLGGGTWLIIAKPWQKSNPALTDTNSNLPQTLVNESTDKSVTKNSNADEIKNKNTATKEPMNAGPGSEIANEETGSVKETGTGKLKDNNDVVAAGSKVNAASVKTKTVSQRKNNKADQLAIIVADPGKTKKDNNLPENNTNVSPKENSNDKLATNDVTVSHTDPPVDKTLSRDKSAETKKDDAIELPKTTDEKKIAKKNSSKKGNNFFFSFSAGPDMSFVSSDKPGKMKLLTGAGFGYTFNNRWTVSSGFYAGRKIYSADKEQYKPTDPLPYYNYIEKINADCKVYEIPVSIAYNFSSSEKHNVFASVGLSSYIMKRESYDYLYNYSGTSYTNTKTVSNENKHYFSVLTLSGGYKININKTFSLTAEPYFKLPLSGVGYGKVKLNSAGVLFSVDISPFRKTANK